jgi:hypothetical protein
LRKLGLAERARRDPHLEVTRQEADDLLEIAWSNFLNDFELLPLWRELERRFGLKSHFKPGERIIPTYYLDDVVEALERRARGESAKQEEEPTDNEEEIEEVYDIPDDELVTALQVLDELPVGTRKDPRDFVRRLGVATVTYDGREPLFRFGDVRLAWKERQRD